MFQSLFLLDDYFYIKMAKKETIKKWLFQSLFLLDDYFY